MAITSRSHSSHRSLPKTRCSPTTVSAIPSFLESPLYILQPSYVHPSIPLCSAFLPLYLCQSRSDKSSTRYFGIQPPSKTAKLCTKTVQRGYEWISDWIDNTNAATRRKEKHHRRADPQLERDRQGYTRRMVYDCVMKSGGRCFDESKMQITGDLAKRRATMCGVLKRTGAVATSIAHGEDERRGELVNEVKNRRSTVLGYFDLVR